MEDMTTKDMKAQLENILIFYSIRSYWEKVRFQGI